jgi:type IV fimbrial biogenesis protein FimT
MRRYRPNTSRGFTLVELMVTLAVLAILLAMALPSFRDFAERSWLRGAADNVASVIGAAKEESIKRDSLVKVDFKAVGTGFCVGAAAVATASTAGCDCSATSCPVAAYPTSPSELHAVRLVGTPAFGSPTPDTNFVIDPKTAMLADVTDTGGIELDVPRGYGIKVLVNAMGRVTTCTPSGKKGLSGVGACP